MLSINPYARDSILLSPKDSWLKTQLASSAMIERRMPRVNQGANSRNPSAVDSLNAAASVQRIFQVLIGRRLQIVAGHV